jgi:integrase
MTTYVNYRRVLDLYLIPTLGRLQIQKLTVRHLQMFYSDLSKTLKSGRVRYIHSILHNALEHAVKEGLVARNVSQHVQLPRREKPELHVLTLEQASQLIEAARKERFKVLLTLAVTTGMRQGELLGLKWQDIDWEKRQIQVRRSIARMKGQSIIEIEPKTAGSRRKIALPSFVLDLLQEHRVRQQEIRQKAGDAWRNLDLVFCAWHGGYIYPSFLGHVFRKILAEAGLPHVRFHDLRHSAVTILLEMGVPAHVVQEIAGHSNISTTLGIYGHVLPGQQEKAVNKWEDTLGDAGSSQRRELLRQQWQGYSLATRECLEALLKQYGEEAAKLAIEAIQNLEAL